MLTKIKSNKKQQKSVLWQLFREVRMRYFYCICAISYMAKFSNLVLRYRMADRTRRRVNEKDITTGNITQ